MYFPLWYLPLILFYFSLVSTIVSNLSNTTGNLRATVTGQTRATISGLSKVIWKKNFTAVNVALTVRPETP